LESNVGIETRNSGKTKACPFYSYSKTMKMQGVKIELLDSSCGHNTET
jgi:hypothetical protein